MFTRLTYFAESPSVVRRADASELIEAVDALRSRILRLAHVRLRDIINAIIRVDGAILSVGSIRAVAHVVIDEICAGGVEVAGIGEAIVHV